MKRKKLSLHVNHEVKGAVDGSALSSEPGVYECEFHPPGEHWYQILLPSGKVGTVNVPDEFWDVDFCARLWRQFYRRVQPRLAIVPGGRGGNS
jgi:hypothetical protein